MKLAIAFILLFSIAAQPSPHPMMGRALINQVQNASVFSQMGFEITHIPTDWSLKNPPSTDGHVLELAPKTGIQKTILSFSSDKVSAKTDLEKYVRQYLRDYNLDGFEVMGLQSLKKSPVDSVIVDLNQKNKSTRSRQIFFKNNDQIILATCLDSFDQFSKTILTCNAILETFKWR